MLDRLPFIGKSTPIPSTKYYTQIESHIKKQQLFFKELQKWRNLEIHYTSKLSQYHHNLSTKGDENNDQINNQLGNVMAALLNNHKSLINKMNYDVFLRNYDEIQKLLNNSKRLLQDEKKVNAQLFAKKEELDKVIVKKQKLKKLLEEQQTTYIFMNDSIDATMDKKIKSLNKKQQLKKESDEYDIKVKETKQIYYQLICTSKQNQKKFNELHRKRSKERYEALIKFQLHLGNYSKSLTQDIDELTKLSSTQFSAQTLILQNNFTTEVEKYLHKLQYKNEGYLERCLYEIDKKNLDEIICYSKNNDIKRKIKKIIESTQVNPEETDEITRQVQLVKKILTSNEKQSIQCFKTIINKNSKFRINFIFILQLYRLNSKFQIPIDELEPIISLTNELLISCHQNKDSFVLKQVMVLLMTYYVLFKSEDKQEKVYIVHFFKNGKLWRDLQLWESILIQCIYIEKSATVRMFIVTSSTSNKGQLMQTQKTAILNQFLYIVRNMVLFDFSQREIRQFTAKFIKLLKQDEKFLKDIQKSISDALKEEEGNFYSQEAKQWIKAKCSNIL